MSEESDFDDDIDKLLDEIDSAGQQRTAAKASVSSKPEEPSGNGKVTLKSDGNGFKVNYGGGGFKLSDLNKPAPNDSTAPKPPPAKAVHFPTEPSPSSQPSAAAAAAPKPNFLSNLLGKETRPESPTAQTSKPSSAAKADWLGLGPSSPLGSPKPSRKISTGAANDSTINFDDDNDNAELLKSMGFDSARKSKPTEDKKPAMSNPGTAKPKPSGLDLDDDFWPKPATLKPKAPPSLAKSDTFDKPEPTAGSALLQRKKLARDREESPFESFAAAPKFQPQATSTPSSGPAKSIVDVLPFLKRPGDEQQVQHDSFEPAMPPRSMTSTPQPPMNRNPTSQPAKAKGKKAAAVTINTAPAVLMDGRSTLHLPSHLVDEEELKSMSHSLKTLYSNQIEMLEKSYQEQMECLLQSHARKEDLLKEEIKVLHKDYDSRLARLKNELLESETRIPQQRLQNELSTMAVFSQQLQQAPSVFKTSDVDSPRSVQQTSHPNPMPAITSKDIERVFEEKLPSVLEAFKSSLPKDSTTSKDLKELTAKFDAIQRKFDAIASFKIEEESKKTMQLIDAEKKLADELVKLHKQQKKVKEGLVKAAVTAVSQTLQYHQDENSHKKDKISGQLKEFRKDVRRILFDLENKNESIHKSHFNIESDQKEILQTLRDLQTHMQANSIRDKFISFGVPQAFNGTQNQSEMEVKMLREERNSLSESIAQMNVERRKLNEERLNLEQEKMSFEREKNRMRDLEVQLKVKTAEAEDMKRQAEDVRKTESAKVMEATMKSSEIERERAMLKEHYHLTESKLRVREHKLIQEKAELMREKEFLEKLRDQLLCPGCMKSVNQLTSSRSEGDGLDISISGAGDLSSRLTATILPRDDDAYLQNQSLYLDDLYYKQFK